MLTGMLKKKKRKKKLRDMNIGIKNKMAME